MGNVMTNKKNTKLKFILMLAAVIVVGLLAFFMLSGGNLQLLKSLFFEEHTSEELKAQMSDLKLRGFISIAVLSALQVVMTFLPAEPTQVLAGAAFGIPLGLLCCLIGVFIGNSLIFLICKLSGNRARAYFAQNLQFNFDKATHAKKTTWLILILYILPAIPYGLICFFAATVNKKYLPYIIITMIGTLPSELMGIVLGHMATASSWIVTVLVFLAIVAGLIFLKYKKDWIFEKLNAYINRLPYDSQTAVQKCNGFILDFAWIVSAVIFFFKGLRIRLARKINEDIKTPCIVLCNHGSFIDFAYAGRLLRKKRPHFIVARLYFYKKSLAGLIKRVGCFPKSMFASDLESAKNCLRVLKGGGILAMMPEARLSTAGKFEDIQEGTYDFLKKAGVPVYSIKIRGDYFAKPKWGKGLRRGAVVEATLDKLFTVNELKELSREDIKCRVENRLYCDEFAWLQKRPELHYHSRRLAEGLENILSKCPKCHQKYTILTKGHDVCCENCGKLATLNSRYGFNEGAPFENFSLWYEWQTAELRKEIERDPEFSLVSQVEFFLPSKDGKTMLRAVGHGTCTLDREGLTYTPKTEKDDNKPMHFGYDRIYRLLFGAGENFELYVGQTIHYFVPKEKRSAVDWYLASAIFADMAKEAPPQP